MNNVSDGIFVPALFNEFHEALDFKLLYDKHILGLNETVAFVLIIFISRVWVFLEWVQTKACD